MNDSPENTDRMSKQRDDAPQEPMIRFGDHWVPAHEVWSRMETATVVVEAIERFNANHPKLSSAHPREVVPLVRQRLKNISLRMPSREPESNELETLCAALLETLPPEKVIDRVREAHGETLDLTQLIQLAGQDAYLTALVREALVYKANGISPEQTAELWTDAHRPVPSGGLWNTYRVEELLHNSG